MRRGGCRLAGLCLRRFGQHTAISLLCSYFGQLMICCALYGCYVSIRATSTRLNSDPKSSLACKSISPPYHPTKTFFLTGDFPLINPCRMDYRSNHPLEWIRTSAWAAMKIIHGGSFTQVYCLKGFIRPCQSKVSTNKTDQNSISLRTKQPVVRIHLVSVGNARNKVFSFYRCLP